MFEQLPAYADDPILGLFEAYKADPRPHKVNLGIGIYCDEQGRVPVLASVRAARALLAEADAPSVYAPTEGAQPYRDAVRRLVFGELETAPIVVVQTVAGTGALKTGADLLKDLSPEATVWMPDPTWANHAAIFEGAGLRVDHYPYYDGSTGGFDLDGAIATLGKLPAGDIVLLHPCCHNPTGVDPSHEEWHALFDTIAQRGLLPFFDTWPTRASLGAWTRTPGRCANACGAASPAWWRARSRRSSRSMANAWARSPCMRRAPTRRGCWAGSSSASGAAIRARRGRARHWCRRS